MALRRLDVREHGEWLLSVIGNRNDGDKVEVHCGALRLVAEALIGPGSPAKQITPDRRMLDIVQRTRAGETLEEIGATLSITRERVRQLLVKYEQMTGEAVTRVQRARGQRTRDAAALRRKEAERERKEQRAQRIADGVAAVRRFVELMGRAPLSREVGFTGGVKGNPLLRPVRSAIGTLEHHGDKHAWRTLMSMAELPPRKGHTHCRRGHEYTPENTMRNRKVIKGKEYFSRACRTCHHAAARKRDAERCRA